MPQLPSLQQDMPTHCSVPGGRALRSLPAVNGQRHLMDVSKYKTHLDVNAAVAVYALGRDKVSCIDCTDGYPAIIHNFAALQDKIGWGNFMMGMISSKLFSIQ